MTDKALQPIEQKTVLFYEDEVLAVRLASGEVLVPIRPICDNLGLSLAGQRERINRDPVLSEEASSVRVTRTQQAREMLCLPLKYIPGFLFGVNANRVKTEIRDRLITYQRECYDVLAEAFQEGRLTADPAFDDLLASDSPAAFAYKVATAVQIMARQQLILESQLVDHDQRLEALEAKLSDPEQYITDAQASQLSQAVKTVAMKLSKASGRNEYGGVYGELYRRYDVPSYRQLPAAKFEDAMSWLNEWRDSIEGELPF